MLIPGRIVTPNLPSAPVSPSTGELYYDTATSSLYYWNGTVWIAANSSNDTPELRVRLATANPTGSLTAANVAGVYANGTAGVGATKSVGGTTLTIDGVAVINGDRVLLKDQTTATENGIYVVSGVGTAVLLTRASDADAPWKFTNMFGTVAEGTFNQDTVWTCPVSTPTIGTTSIYFRRTLPFYGGGLSRDFWTPGGDTTSVVAQNGVRSEQASLLTLATAATAYAVGLLTIPSGRTVTNVNFVYTTAAATITIFWVAVLRATDRVVLGVSANDSAAWAAAPAVKTKAVTTPFVVPVDTPVYVVIALASTTAAVVEGVTQNAGFTGRPPILAGTLGTAPTTTPLVVGAAASAITAGTAFLYSWLT